MDSTANKKRQAPSKSAAADNATEDFRLPNNSARVRVNLNPSQSKLARYAEGPLKMTKRDWKAVNGSNGGGNNGAKFKRLRKTLEETQEKIVEAATAAALADDILLTQSSGCLVADANNGEKTYKLKQRDMRPLVDLNTSKNMMDFYLTKFGPYRVNYSRNGRYIRFLCFPSYY